MHELPNEAWLHQSYTETTRSCRSWPLFWWWIQCRGNILRGKIRILGNDFVCGISRLMIPNDGSYRYPDARDGGLVSLDVAMLGDLASG